ncbi:type II toxin-antitoxin system ParD family antitoxin [Roseibium aggregatum]|uniref:Type II toxin-antitoxin system ParD family antitoxin n=1 Tax=Roseibium aggregatum TaxID=187304 RepID=A0A926SAN0_9HYPH|nr:type II toxin-antitoxin system ParD family antitoxin [Roseibium aggregatum]MBD1549534.1 type II toxin-antitoxin system ParD family antitoxin [Roseibium aggregatum]
MKPSGQMTITLTNELEQFVRGEVTAGPFASNSEYIRELVRERYRQKLEREEKMKTLNAALARGMADSAAGRVTPLAEAFEKVRAALDITADESQHV